MLALCSLNVTGEVTIAEQIVSVHLGRMQTRAADLVHSQSLSHGLDGPFSLVVLGSNCWSPILWLARSFRPNGEFTAGSRRALDSCSSDQQPYMTCQEPMFACTLAQLCSAPWSRRSSVCCGTLPLISSPERWDFWRILMHATIQNAIYSPGSCVKPLSRTRGDGKQDAQLFGGAVGAKDCA